MSEKPKYGHCSASRNLEATPIADRITRLTISRIATYLACGGMRDDKDLALSHHDTIFFAQNSSLLMVIALRER
jgi:hypothetical protein